MNMDDDLPGPAMGVVLLMMLVFLVVVAVSVGLYLVGIR
jgi:hypothetical protein